MTMQTSDSYDHQVIEAKWQARWDEAQLYRTPDRSEQIDQTFYCLEFFPYPSGDGLSVGHGRNYVPTDVVSRYHRMRGEAVLHPMGWDAFGLPAENEAIRRGIHPRQTTTQYAANYRRQLTLLGCSYDWDREINSSHPDFYRWTQWFFLMLYHRGLAYRAPGQQWWCPECKTVLANEQIEAGGICWRCSQVAEKRDMEQWYFRITKYAAELLADLETLDWPEHILTMQRNWIGRSDGVAFDMAVLDQDVTFEVFTTRPDTIFGVTFAVLAPEHPLVKKITTPAQKEAVEIYRQAAARRTDLDRMQGNRNRDGVFTGAYAINPINQRQIPIYIADYVLMSYGSGAIMAVPAHDERDFDFANSYHIPVEVVIQPPDWDGQPLTIAYTGSGTLINSGQWDGQPSEAAQAQIAAWLAQEKIGQQTVQYRMRDWLISRQRYWGAPIPMIHCDACGIVPVPEDQLPVLLPDIQDWTPGDDGRSPLANVPSFVNTTCPACGGPAQRETDTMDGFACSSWYFLRFVSPHEKERPFDPAALEFWGRPDLYVGGAEHATMHLLYARFWVKVMADAGLISFREPFPVLRSQGMMGVRDPETGLTPKMSKSKGNVVTPESMVARYGSDALRVYLMFIAPFENSSVWDEAGINGTHRFLQRAWRLVNTVANEPVGPSPSESLCRDLISQRHQTVKRVTEDIEAFKFNTAVAAMMAYSNNLITYQQTHGVTAELQEVTRTFVKILAPFAPFIGEEMWERLEKASSVHQQSWPIWDEALVIEDAVELVVQVDGRVRGKMTVSTSIPESEAQRQALSLDSVQRHIDGQNVARVIYVPGRLINIVTA